MIEYLGENDLMLKDTEGSWAMNTNQGSAYWLDYNKVVNKFNELVETVNRLEEKVNEMV